MSQTLLHLAQLRSHSTVLETIAVRSAEDLLPLLETVSEEMVAWDFPDGDIFAMRLALEEAVINGIKHGHQYDPAKVVQVSYRVMADEVLAEVEDEGPGFNPDQVPDPLAPANLERSCGRGLLLMQHYMTSVERNARGNRVTLCKCKTCG